MFDVYDDFLSYGSGIYKVTSGDLIGMHAVKVIGYGQQNQISYYICENQWGTSWGEEGYFRIEVGQANIDKYGYSCDA